jgi:TolB-like protein/Tfp pilus assembly protein PilF
MPNTTVARGRRLAAIMFADIVGYTAMMQDNEAEARIVCSSFRSLLQNVLPPRSGEIVQFYGDGALIIFDSAKEAVLAALAIQQTALRDPTIPLRTGIHVGDVVHDESGVYGDGVNIASRIESMAIPGAVLLSEQVKREIENHPDIRTVPLGEYNLKNIKRPVRVHALRDDQITVPLPGQIHAESKASARTMVAVMPFTSFGPDDDSTYFADGLSQEIVNGLTKVEGLSIISRSTCLAIQVDAPDPISVGKRLNVRNILEGSVRKAGTDIRVSVQLVNTADGSQLWSEKYDRRLDNVFEVQDEIAQLVVNGLKLNFDLDTKDRRIIARATDNVEAYNLYLKGLHHWNSRTPESGQKAVQLLEDALELDPEFPTAKCTLSQCYAYLGSCGVLPPRDAYGKALEHAMSAIERDPKMAEAHLALAVLKFYHLWDWIGTRASLDKAEALGLDSAEFHQVYGFYLAATGQPREGLPKVQRAVELDPLSVPTIYVLAALHFFCEEYDTALRLLDEIIELNPGFRGAYQVKGFALLMLDRHEEALTVLEQYHALVNHPLKGLMGLTLVHDRLGNEERVADFLARMYQRLDEEAGVAAEIDLALVCAGLGRFDKAIEHLNSVYDQRYSIACTGMIWILRCSYFSALWEQPGYKLLLERMGLER